MIELKNISKSYGTKQVLKNFSHSFKKGSKSCLMGESGRGKTTLLNLILGLLKADEGEITGVPDNVAAVFQEDRLSDDFSAASNVAAVTGDSVSKEEIVGCLNELLLGDSIDLPVSELSGGMRRRVAIARALLAKSELIVFDEPFKGLDDETRETVIKVILARTTGKTLIFVTHDIRDADSLGAEIINI